MQSKAPQLCGWGLAEESKREGLNMVEVGDGAPPAPFIIRSGSRRQGSNGALLPLGHGRIGSDHGKQTSRRWQPEVARAEEAAGESRATTNSGDELLPGDARAGPAPRKEFVMAPSSGSGVEATRAKERWGGSSAFADSSDFWGDVRSGKRAGQELGKFRRTVLGVGKIVQTAGQRMESFTLTNCSDFWGGVWSGKAAASNELQKIRSRVLVEAAAGEDEFREGGGRRRIDREKNRVQVVVASRSLQASSSGRGFLASTAATLGEMRCRRSGGTSGTSSDGSVLDSLSVDELWRHPLAIVSLVPKGLSLFLAGALAGAAAKTVTAPLDRIKLLMQVHGVQAAQNGIKSSIGFMEAIMKIGTEEGVKGYWKGNLPQVIRVIPYSAVQLVAYEKYKILLKGDNAELSVGRRLVAGACAGMTSTLVTYPLDTLRLRMAVDPASKSMAQVIVNMMKHEGLAAFYCGLGPSLLGIAPYIALNFCVFDLVKKSLPEEVRKRPEASLLTALASATFATAMCYPLDTVRRQLQMKGTPFRSVADAIPGIIARDGFLGLYRGFLPNALKNLPSSSIRLTTFDAAKNLISASQAEYDRLLNGRPKTSDPRVEGVEEKTRRD